METKTDKNGSLYIQWSQGKNQQGQDCEKRAWVQHKEGENDWANTGRYLNVVRCNFDGNPGGNPTDFPIFSKLLSDEQILLAFVHSVNAITACTGRPQ